MMPLLLLIFYELRFQDDATKVKIPYQTIIVPLVLVILGVLLGMLSKASWLRHHPVLGIYPWPTSSHWIELAPAAASKRPAH